VPKEEQTKLSKIKINYTDGTTRTLSLSSADNVVVRYKDLNKQLGLTYTNTEVSVLVKIVDNIAVLPNFTLNAPLKTVSNTYMIYENKWVDNEEGTGYKCVITAEESIYTSSYVVLGVYKENNGIKTTAIVDYKTQGNVITIYSDEKFVGGVTIQYTAG
jgi:hypothetical protein